MRQLAIERQASWFNYRRMSTNWISRLARALAALFSWSVPAYPEDLDRDADARRVRRELDAIRIHFPDHA